MKLPPAQKPDKKSGPKVYEKNGRIGKIYPTKTGAFAIKYHFAGERHQTQRATLDGAIEFLESEFTKLDTNQENSLTLYPLRGNVRDYYELEQLLLEQGDGATLRYAVQYFLSNFKVRVLQPKTVQECFDSFVEYQERANNSASQIKTIKKHGKRFAASFGARLIHEISAQEFSDWLDSQIDEKTKAKWRDKTKKNVRGSVVSISIHARDVLKALHHGVDTEFQIIKAPKINYAKPVDIYTSEEVTKLLNEALLHPKYLPLVPAIVIGCFAGLRPNEIHAEETEGEREPLQWESIHWEDKTLHVEGQKVRSIPTRDITMMSNLIEWLKPWEGETGAMWVYKGNYDRRLLQLKKQSGVRSIEDGFRHSFGSYKYRIINKDIDTLADEMGNSANEITKHYKRNVKDADANKYFAIAPPQGYAKIIGDYLKQKAETSLHTAE